MPDLIFGATSEPSYEIRVRILTFLWGSDGLKSDVSFDRPPILHIRNDVFGEVISISRHRAAGDSHLLGTLQPGQCVSLPLQNLTGISANCDLESTVACMITGPN